MKNKILSIIIPIYNSSKFLKKTILSCIKKDQISSYEIVCVNDNSNDKSLGIIKKIKKKYNNIKIITNKKNLGVGITRNIGIKASTGKYILFLDSDDEIIKKRIKKILNFLSKINNDLILMNFFDDENEKFLFAKNIYSKNHLFKGLISEQSINYCFPYIYKREFLYQNRIFFENLRYAEDVIFITIVLSLAKKFCRYNFSLIKHKYNQKGLSSKINLTNDSSYLQAILFLEKFENKNKNLSKIAKNYIVSRKRFCFYQFLLRTLKYETTKIIDRNKTLINKSGKIFLKNNFFSNNKTLNIKHELSMIKKKILYFLGNDKVCDIVIYGYGVVGKSIENILIKENYKNIIFVDDQKSNKDHTKKILNINDLKKKQIMKTNKFIISVPDFKVYKKILKNLKNRGIKKNKIMKYFF